jgi:hypothetical protein
VGGTAADRKLMLLARSVRSEGLQFDSDLVHHALFDKAHDSTRLRIRRRSRGGLSLDLSGARYKPHRDRAGFIPSPFDEVVGSSDDRRY